MRKALGLHHVAPRQVEWLEVRLPPLGPGEVVIQTRYSSISAGTEGRFFEGSFSPEMELDSSIPQLKRPAIYPFPYGYSLVGNIVAVGPGVPADDLGRAAFVFHPHQDLVQVNRDQIQLLPQRVPEQRALFFPYVETAINLVLDAAPLWGERVAVFGQGILGLLVTRLLAEFPLESVVTFDPISERRTRSLEAGANESWESPRAAASCRDLDLALEISGNVSALAQAFDVVGFSGRIVTGSWYGSSVAAGDVHAAFHRNRVTVTSSQVSTIAPHLSGRWSNSRRTAQTWNLLSTLPLENWISSRRPFSEAQLVFEALERDKAQGQVILTYP